MAGRLIALEGIDGAGTTTLAERIARALGEGGQAVHLTREPSRGPIGLELRKILAGAHAPFDPVAVALLFAADRVDHLAREIRPALAAGTHVVSDRYVLSSLAYQSLDVPRDEVAAFNAAAPPADLTLLLDVPVEVAAARRQARGGPVELYDDEAVQRRVAAAYRDEAARLAAAGHAVLVVDATATVDAVFAALWPAVQTCLAGRTATSSKG
jgi:dTMP kinase